MSARVHVTGASGTGTTTLGRALAGRLAVPHADTDDYYWVPTDPPYRAKREPAERLRLMETVFTPRPTWVLSGSVMGWGEPLLPLFDLVVFVSVPHEERMARLRRREALRYGEAAIGPGGALEDAHRDFMTWAAGYEDPDFAGRNRTSHEAWLGAVPAPVLRLDGSVPVADSAEEIAEHLGRP